LRDHFEYQIGPVARWRMDERWGSEARAEPGWRRTCSRDEAGLCGCESGFIERAANAHPARALHERTRIDRPTLVISRPELRERDCSITPAGWT
jgi:hypothetical protein